MNAFTDVLFAQQVSLKTAHATDRLHMLRTSREGSHTLNNRLRVHQTASIGNVSTQGS